MLREVFGNDHTREAAHITRIQGWMMLVKFGNISSRIERSKKVLTVCSTVDEHDCFPFELISLSRDVCVLEYTRQFK